ncbi:ubiquitin-like protein [Angomonas deanei]|uniref:Ubiquitin family/Ubiquitin-2 like Rad60 SUMO-like, putative n=1 Tax=Angomonas deanei TaxID=59799 RepID=A0A7G2C876_9TRYP|nr:ubiquitin-like protein [Angomonas deanei]CAD2215007.1 Ubiquitin family/Ubiquitin-2 like Rad60 SUMO-like, putative [Angomonas deanei]|eukprot:EPY40378.1 ubiquitin-like protein [Angomonas deanei]
MTFTFTVLHADGEKTDISTLSGENTVEDLVKAIEEKTHVPKEMIVLVFSGTRLDLAKTLADYKIVAGVTVTMVVALRAG